MAKIPLRSYNKEIDQLIENGQVAEAVAHCKHILKYFPKHIDTYRLLGQGYLTEQRYTEAADILQRVLSVIPDDFISQIGMSIIREDEGNLDAAIYHMEKAFEVQPAKSAIQSELRRLYGRRDGMEPPKIRLTRGALVRMYLRGELYPQAIAEVRAALADDPNQLDLQVILARLYGLSGQKVQAVEICSRLVSKLPYCLEANRILAEVLPGTSRAEDAKVFHDRLVALDPYYGFLPDGATDSAVVPDNAVQVERLDYNAAAEAAAEQPEWTRAVGVAWEDQEQPSVPSWLEESTPPAALQAPAQSAQPEAPAEEAPAPAEIPDWMAQAGWAHSTGEAAEAPAQFDAEEPEAIGENLAAPGDIPDWLQSLAPETPAVGETESTAEDEAWLQKMVGETAPSTVEPAPVEHVQEAPAVESPAIPGEEIAVPDWLQEDRGAQQPQAAAPMEGEEVLPDWLSSLAEPEAAEEQPAAELSQTAPEAEALPDWLSGLAEPEKTIEQPALDQPQTAAEAEALPDWLSSLGTEESAPTEPEQIAAVEGEEALPDWIQGLGETAEAAAQPAPEVETGVEALPDWLQEAQAPSAEEQVQIETPQAEQPAAAVEEIPDWLAGFGETGVETAETAGEIEASSAQSVGEAVEAPELETALPEETPTFEEVAPTAQAGLEEAPEAAAGVSETAAKAVDAGINPEEDLDSALAWLESLAAKQGASEEELLTQPEQRAAEMPAWIEEEAAQPVQEAAPEAGAPVEEGVSQIGALVFPVEETPAAVEVEPAVEELPSMETEISTAAIEEPVAEVVEAAAEEGGPVEVEVETPSMEAEATTPVEETAAVEEVPALAEELAPEAEAAPAAMGMDDIDSAMAWLEALAAKQGAEEDTLLTAPESRLETPPEWVEAQAAETVETIPQPEAEAQPAGEEIVIEEVPPVEAAPEAVEAVTEAVPEAEAASPVEAPAETPEPEVEGWILESETAEAGEEALPAWLQNLDTFTESTEETPQEGALPEWLQDVEPAEEPGAPAEGISEWTPESAAEESPVQAAVEEVLPVETTVAGSVTAAEAALEPIAEIPEVPAEEKTQPVRAAVYESPVSIPEEHVPEAVEQVEEKIELAAPVEEAPAEAEPVAAGEAPVMAETAQAEPVLEAESAALEQARKALESGDIDTALAHYTELTSGGKELEEIIHDLRDATYRYPMNTDIWQALGDAYYKGNHVQDALDAYTKAIELLR